MRLIPIISRCSLALLLCISAACKSDPPGANPSAAPATRAAAPESTSPHASATVEPGSHEDWCEEHGVPESQCSRCNPSLVAAFKATGDWCEEHGLPESQCRACNPDLKIERPPKNEAAQ